MSQCQDSYLLCVNNNCRERIFFLWHCLRIWRHERRMNIFGLIELSNKFNVIKNPFSKAASWQTDYLVFWVNYIQSTGVPILCYRYLNSQWLFHCYFVLVNWTYDTETYFKSENEACDHKFYWVFRYIFVLFHHKQNQKLSPHFCFVWLNACQCYCIFFIITSIFSRWMFRITIIIWRAGNHTLLYGRYSAMLLEASCCVCVTLGVNCQFNSTFVHLLQLKCHFNAVHIRNSRINNPRKILSHFASKKRLTSGLFPLPFASFQHARCKLYGLNNSLQWWKVILCLLFRYKNMTLKLFRMINKTRHK